MLAKFSNYAEKLVDCIAIACACGVCCAVDYAVQPHAEVVQG
jgi:hypothetical protein